MLKKPKDKKISILMGQYTVIKKFFQPSYKSSNLIIESPAAETCIILVLNSPQGLALAHIDTPFYAKEITQKLISRLKNCGAQNSEIKATLVGGQVSDPLEGSGALYNPIYQVLQAEKINYTHKYYSINIPFATLQSIPLMYLLFRILGYIGPSSYIGTVICFLFTLIAHNQTTAYLSNRFDVSVNTATDYIEVVANDINNSSRIIRQASDAQLAFFKQRNTIMPHDSAQKEKLALQWVQPPVEFNGLLK